MKQRDITLLQRATYLEFEVHTVFGSIPVTMTRDENQAIDVRLKLPGTFLVHDGKKVVGITEKTEHLWHAVLETLSEHGVAVY